MSMKKYAVDMQLHMTVKTLATLQGEINCKLDELTKKAKLLQEKEEEGEEANHLLEMISDNLNDLKALFEQRKNLRNQIENLKRKEIDLCKGVS
jgi:DNA repair exonuclease SbcCD ATPase subunit